MMKKLILKEHEIEGAIEKELALGNLNYTCKMAIDEEKGEDIAIIKELGQTIRTLGLSEIYELISKHFNVKTSSHEVMLVDIYGDCFLFDI